MGIKITTAGYTLGELGPACEPNSNGFCLFSASQSQSKALTLVALAPSPRPTPKTLTTSTQVYSSLNPSVSNDSITLSAQVIASGAIPSGTVGFTQNGVALSGCASQELTSGVATCTTSALITGTDSNVATYPGTTGFDASTSEAYTQYVTATQTRQTVPYAPTNVITVPGNQEVTVSWEGPLVTGGETITGYSVTYGSSGTGNYTTAGCTTTSATNCTVTGLSNGQDYTFLVTATNSIGTGPAAYSSSVAPNL